MKHKISEEIEGFIKDFESKPGVGTRWKKPIIGYASADDPIFPTLKEVAVHDHLQPREINPEAKTVIAYFLPFEDWIVESNLKGEESSFEWARAYVETNTMIQGINDYLIEYLSSLGYKTEKLPSELNMDHERLVSVWSNRHVSYIAGLGTFGINNMLITESGCCGRLGNVVTSLKLEPSVRPDREFCLFKFDGSCGICLDNCKISALSGMEFDRFGCDQVLKQNAKLYQELGNPSCCGKCLVGLPCSTIDPTRVKE